MVYRLEMCNFYSFRDPQVVDLRVGEGVPECPGRLTPLFPGSLERSPRVVAFFGPNASGKSTVLKALRFIAWFAADSFQRQPNTGLPCERFNDAESVQLPVKLAIEFSGPMDLTVEKVDESTIQGTWRYELEFRLENSFFVVASENLRQRVQGKGKWIRVFERTGDRIAAGKGFGLSGYAMVTDKVRNNASLISTLAQFDHKPSLRLHQAARQIIGNILVERTEVKDDDAIRYYAMNVPLMDQLNQEIQRIDLGIRKMNIVQSPNGPLALFEHEGLEQPMPWPLESHGTRSFIRNYPLLQLALSNGGVAVIDEIDISIHPLVLPEIIRWFHDPERNPRGAQLWTTCHAATLLEDLLKEEVFFCEKDSKGRTSVYGLQDIRDVRRTDNRYRKYLSGVYGAVPHIG
jgi:AAA domain, putative AbiEii toxin, Type IV TA system